MIKVIILIAFTLFSSQISFAQAPFVDLPKPGTLFFLSQPTTPIVLSGLKINFKDPFHFDFILEDDGSKHPDSLLKEEGMRQVNYFLAALAFKSTDLWVNLSPYEKNRIIPDMLETTALGRDLLVQDYVLKQLASSLTYPNGQYGKKFWDFVYARAKQQHVKQIPLNTFNKVWITPDKAQVYVKNNTVIVTKMHLKVMIEQDYLAAIKHQANISVDPTMKAMKDIIVPILEEEVNIGAHFKQLRQIVSTAILAEWYKRHLKESIFAKEYVNHGKINGINENPKETKEYVYRQYLAAYKKGVYNFIQEFPQTPSLPRKYFAGGLNVDVSILTEDGAIPSVHQGHILSVDLADQASTAAQNAIDQLKNPYLANMEERLGNLVKRDDALADVVNVLLNKPVRIVEGWENIDGHLIYHVRDARSAVLGTPKGGIRWVTASDLLKDNEFKKEWGRFIFLDPTQEEARNFVKTWMDQETKALALAMTLKTAGIGLNLGGAKASVFIGDIGRGHDGRWKLTDWPWENKKNDIARLHARRLAQAAAVGINIDSPAPDMKTTPRILEIYNDEYLRFLAEQPQNPFGEENAELYRRLRLILKQVRLYEGGVKVYRSSIPLIEKTPFLKVAYDYWRKGLGKDRSVPWLGVFTGKRVQFGGANGRNESTGRGVIEVLKEYFKIKYGEGSYQGKTVAVQAMGNVGRYTALAAAEAGFDLRVISDANITITKKAGQKGWSVEELHQIIKELEKGASLFRICNMGIIDHQTVEVATHETATQEELTEKVLFADVDVLIPAFREGVINGENASKIQAKIIIEAANGPVTTQAAAILTLHSKEIIPDTLANAGGVGVSSIEMEQAKEERQYSQGQVLSRSSGALAAATGNILAMQQRNGVLLREAFDLYALSRIKDANQAMAARTNGGIDLNMSTMPLMQKGVLSLSRINMSQHVDIKSIRPIFISLKPVNIASWINQP